ncbi:MAG: NAD-dependent epimerase/dehydratase family protein [Myxococcota bacterium]|nr:NAD-dependent epimerase/dehydratase family protein [Myxococcota bacterium]
MRVLVTGANGHIGSNLVRELIGRGHQVVAFIRENSNHEGLEGLELERKYGDVRDADSIHKAAHRCETIINLAAVYAWGGTIHEIVEPAIQGVENVLKAAQEHNIERVVHTSSIVAVGMAKEAKVLDASHWTTDTSEPYIMAKTQSEKIAWAKAEELNVPLIVINPAGIIGRHDYKLTPSNAFVRDYAHGLGGVFKGGVNYVDVRDVAFIHALALTQGKPGERYIVSGPNLTPKDFAQAISHRTDSSAMPYFLPRWMLVPLAGMLEKIQGPKGPIKKGLAEEFYHRWSWYDCSKTEETFAWKAKGIEEMVDESLSWLAHRNILKPKIAQKVIERIGERDFSS